MKPEVREAFLAVRNQFSPDRVVADAVLNDAFIEACRQRGLTQTACQLNMCLLNMRKAKDLTGLRSRRTSFAHQDDYVFASEIAARFLQRRDGVSLDRVICDPNRAAEFDRLACRIAPGYSPLQYRWAALRLRKARRLSPELVAHVAPPETVRTSPVAELDLAELPAEQGLYVLFDSSTTLYVGETRNLRKRIQKHLDHSDNKGLARWLWRHGPAGLHVEYHVLPQATLTRVRKALETELIRSRRPVFNVTGGTRRQGAY